MSTPTYPFTAPGFDGLIGTEYLQVTPELARARFTVRDELKQPFGLLHGGVFAAVAEGLASVATAFAVAADGKLASGLSNQTSFLRPALSGTVHATAVRKHAGRSTWVWEVEFTDEAGKLCALTRMTIAVRDLRPGQEIPEGLGLGVGASAGPDEAQAREGAAAASAPSSEIAARRSSASASTSASAS